jgi:hypothetical protein
MKWYYFFTPDYEFWHRHIQESLNDHFTLVSLEIEPSSLRLNEGPGHHFKGCPVKLDLVIECIQANIGDSIVFSDSTLHFNRTRVQELAEYVQELAERADLIFADNRIDKDVNIGVMLIRCNRRTLRFWKRVRAGFSRNQWDQQLVNDALAAQGSLASLMRSRVSWTTFDSSRVICGYQFDEACRDGFFVFKQFIHPGSRTSNWNERIMALNRSGFIDNRKLADLLRAES